MASVNHENKRGSGKNLKVHFELPEYEDHQITHQQHPKSSISSDSDSNSDLDSDSDSDSSQELDATSKEDHSINTLESNHASTEFPSSAFSTEFNYPSPAWSYQSGSTMLSPQIQVMGRDSGYDPNRIPLSIFSSKSTNPTEWSLTSNESLFSIHIGNNSFSKDVLNWKSGEFPMSTTLPPVEEIIQSKDAEIERHSVSTESSQESADVENLSKLISKESSEESTDVVTEKRSELIENSAETATIVLRQTPENYNKEATVPSEEARSSTSVSHHSGSIRSSHSFQFPILAGCVGRTSSATAESEKQQPETPLQPPSPKTETQPKPGVLQWFNCFSCCSLCKGKGLK